MPAVTLAKFRQLAFDVLRVLTGEARGEPLALRIGPVTGLTGKHFLGGHAMNKELFTLRNQFFVPGTSRRASLVGVPLYRLLDRFGLRSVRYTFHIDALLAGNIHGILFRIRKVQYR